MARLGMALPNLPGVTPLIPEFARRIEAGGFAAVWSLDRLVYENPDPLTALAASVAVTSRVRLGTSILLAPEDNSLAARSPLVVRLRPVHPNPLGG